MDHELLAASDVRDIAAYSAFKIRESALAKRIRQSSLSPSG
jgi:hypothetical protein